MIDLELERKVFEKAAFQASGGWASFEKDSNGHYHSDKLNFGFDMWLKRAEQENAEIDSLKAQLAKVESGEFVVVPKEPTEAMIKHAYGTYEGATILPYSFYKAMIEAAQENSHDNSN